MKITINVDESLHDTEIIVNCKTLTPETEQIISALRLLDKQITVTKDNDSYFLDISKSIYVE